MKIKSKKTTLKNRKNYFIVSETESFQHGHKIVPIPMKSGEAYFIDEPQEWMSLSPSERFEESAKLWKIYLALGGSLDPQPDPQSPFYIQET